MGIAAHPEEGGGVGVGVGVGVGGIEGGGFAQGCAYPCGGYASWTLPVLAWLTVCMSDKVFVASASDNVLVASARAAGTLPLTLGTTEVTSATHNPARLYKSGFCSSP